MVGAPQTEAAQLSIFLEAAQDSRKHCVGCWGGGRGGAFLPKKVHGGSTPLHRPLVATVAFFLDACHLEISPDAKKGQSVCVAL